MWVLQKQKQGTLLLPAAEKLLRGRSLPGGHGDGGAEGVTDAGQRQDTPITKITSQFTNLITNEASHGGVGSP